MLHPFHIVAIVAGGVSVAIGDLLIKKVGTVSTSMASAMVHPLMLAALCFYILQIVLFAYVFVERWELRVVAIMQMAFYAPACVLMGRLLFGERVTTLQGLGMVLAFSGAVLMNGGR